MLGLNGAGKTTLLRLIAVELKLESFQPAHVGQMELYLRWLDKHERAPGEEAPIGLILCAQADTEQIERWVQWLRAGYSGHDLRDVVLYLRKQIAAGTRGQVETHVFPSHAELATYLKAIYTPGDLVLLKASRGMALERLAELLAK